MIETTKHVGWTSSWGRELAIIFKFTVYFMGNILRLSLVFDGIRRVDADVRWRKYKIVLRKRRPLQISSRACPPDILELGGSPALRERINLTDFSALIPPDDMTTDFDMFYQDMAPAAICSLMRSQPEKWRLDPKATDLLNQSWSSCLAKSSGCGPGYEL